MPKGLKIIRADGNPMTVHQWRRNSRSDYDDILTGYQRNEDLGWYKEVVDPNGQKRATQDLNSNGVACYDWAYHEKKWVDHARVA